MKHRVFAIRFSAWPTIALAVGLVMIPGPGTRTVLAADKEMRQMMADIRMLQEQLQQLQNLIAALSKAMGDALDAATKTVNARVDAKLEEQNNSTTRGFANQKVSIDAMTRDVVVLREKMDENNVRVGSLTQEVTALRQVVTQINAVRSAADPILGPPDSVAPVQAATTGIGMSPKAAWDQAYGDYTAGQYDFAIQGFEAYIKSFPNAEMADDAQVYICSTYLQMGNNAKVIQACDVAIRNYPTSNRLAEAYYRKGQAFKNMARIDDARTAFEYVVKTYPNSQEASLAATQLASPQLARKP